LFSYRKLRSRMWLQHRRTRRQTILSSSKELC